MAVGVVDTGKLVQWILMGHQRLNPMLHKCTYQPHTGKALLLQCGDRLQKVLHLTLETRLRTVLPLVRRHRLLSGEHQSTVGHVLSVEPLALIQHEGGEQDLKLLCLPAEAESPAY